jgi:hypothetical protein
MLEHYRSQGSPTKPASQSGSAPRYFVSLGRCGMRGASAAAAR